MSENKKDLSVDFMMLAFNKIDDLMKSNSNLSFGINELNFAIISLQENCKDLKEELKQTRHDSKDAIISISKNYDSLDERITQLEKEKHQRDILDKDKKIREKKRISFFYWSFGAILALIGVLHVSWKKFMESLMTLYG